MYCKLFASLYQGTLRGRSHEILVFTNLLANADKEGYVDKHFRAIAEEVGLTVDETRAALQALEDKDEESRSPEHEGRRIVRISDERTWGWLIVNYAKYRAIRSEEDRREQNRLAQERWRKRQESGTPEPVIKVSRRKPQSAEVSPDKPPSAHSEAHTDTEGKKSTRQNGEDGVASPIKESRQRQFSDAFKAAWEEQHESEYPFKAADGVQLAALLKSCSKLECAQFIAGLKWCWQVAADDPRPPWEVGQTGTLAAFCTAWPKIIACHHTYRTRK